MDSTNATQPLSQQHRIAAFLMRLLVLLYLTILATNTSAEVLSGHALAMHGEPKYQKGFEQFEYTSPEAKKGGELKLHSLGTYDSLNGFTAKGNKADHLGLIYDTLTVASADEAFTQYGLVAKWMEYPADLSWIIFQLDDRARFHDQTHIRADDIVFSFYTLMEKGDPSYRFYYADVEKVQALSDQRVIFKFKPTASRELALTVGQLPILPQHYWANRDFEKSDLEKPLGSGPYRIGNMEPGRTISYERVEDYWAINHPTRKGLYNFNTITHDYYRDGSVALEALKAGEYDVRRERVSKLWATAYTGNAIDNGELKTLEVEHENPTGMQAYIFNTRKNVFKNPKLRQAIILAFDFEWTNQNLFYGAYKRTSSYFSNSELASSGLPSKTELRILKPLKNYLPPEVFTDVYAPPKSDGKDRNRKNLRQAKKILDEEGFKVVDNQLIDPESGLPVEFEILLYDLGFERVTNPFIQGLKKLGITANIRLVDTSQYINRMRSFDFDMMVHVFGQSLSPGNEQREMWHSSAANTPGSRNLVGIEDPAIDKLVETIIKARTRKQLVTAAKALDRALLNGHYVIPHWHINHHRIAYWDKFNRPETSPKYDGVYDTGLMSWWIKDSVIKSTETDGVLESDSTEN
jgi:microcin C transport system substrate-binding protein